MFIKKSIQSALILGMLSSTVLSPQMVSAMMERSPQSVSESMSDLDMKLKLDILKATLGPLKLGFRYQYRAKPTYEDQMFSREDKYILDTSLEDGFTLNEGENFELNLVPNIEHKGIITFARLFRTHVEARTADAYHPLKHFPMNSKDVIENLKTGDFVSFKSKLNVSVRVDSTIQDTADFDSKLSAKKLIGGDFELILLKQSESEILLRLISTSKNENQFEYVFEYTDLIAPTNAKIINKAITRLLDPKLVEILFKKGKGTSTLAEYKIDLNNPQAKIAFDQLLKSTYKFKAQTDAIKDLDIKKVTERMTINLAEFDELTNSINNPSILNSVKKSKKIENVQTYTAGRFKIGFRGLFLDDKSTYSRNYLTRTDEDGHTEHFAVLSYRRLFEDGAAFKYASEADIQMNAVMTTEPEFKNAQFKELVLSGRRTDVEFRKDENNKMKLKLIHTLPKKYLDQIDFSEFENRAIDNSYVNYQMILSPQAFTELQKLKLTKKRIKQLLENYLKPFGNTIRTPKRVRDTISFLNAEERQDPLIRYGKHIDGISNILSSSLKEGNTDYQRMEEFIRLRNNPLFHVVGVGFLMSLLPQENIEDTVALSLTLEGQGIQKLDKTFGNFTESEAYESLMLGVETLYDEGMSVRRIQEAMMATLLQLPPIE